MKNKISLILRIIIAILLVQTLYFKWGDHAQAIHIFDSIELEPNGRYGLGFIELVIAVLLLLKKTHLKGSLICLLLMIGAICTHLFTPIGIIVEWDGLNDGGNLFALALICLIFSIANLILNKERHHFNLKAIIKN
jgi:hypothetical protein